MVSGLQPVAQGGIGIRLAHDPGDPLITSHCPFCGSGQVVGRSDGTIECDFCGQNYIVRVQPAFPGMPQMPGEGGAASDIGPDGGVLPPDAIGPDGLPVGGAPPGMGDPEMDEEGGAPFPPGDDEDDPDEDGSGPPGDAGGPPAVSPPPKKDKGDSKGKGDSKKPPPKSKKGAYQGDPVPRPGEVTGGVIRTYFGLDGQVLTEGQFIRHMAANLSGGDPRVLAQLRAEAGR